MSESNYVQPGQDDPPGEPQPTTPSGDASGSTPTNNGNGTGCVFGGFGTVILGMISFQSAFSQGGPFGVYNNWGSIVVLPLMAGVVLYALGKYIGSRKK